MARSADWWKASATSALNSSAQPTRRTLQIKLGALVLLCTTSLVLLFGSIHLHWIRNQAARIVAGEVQKRALHHARSLAVETFDAVLQEDKLSLKQILAQTRALDPDIAYVFLVGRQGDLLAHTFARGFPEDLLTATARPAQSTHRMLRVVDTQGQEQPLMDVVMPIARGRESAGFVHVGFREALIGAPVRSITGAATWMVAVFVLLGLMASLAISTLVGRPLESLAAATRKMNLDALPGAATGLSCALPRPLSWLRLSTEVDRLGDDFRNMTRRLADAHGQLEDTRKQLAFAERLSTLGTMAAGLAHELNNPLAGLRNCLRRIQRAPEDREQLEQYVALMQQSIEHMGGTLRGLLNLAKPHQPEMAAVPLAPLLDRVIALAADKLAEASVSPGRELRCRAEAAWADERLLEESLLNLVLNACDALIRRQQREPGFRPELTIRAMNGNQRVCIEVQDNGAGIKAEDLPRIFDPFFTTKAGGGGTGLGLSIAQDLIRVQGGDVTAASRPGEGATFRVILPEAKNI